jgi:phospholipid/cholesterol/gamma-HCH transport system substrate-binding protein
MGRNAIETVLGAVVLVVAALFMVFAYSSADLQKVQGYEISAYFPMVDGLKEGTDVKINGVKVGSITRMDLVTEPGPHQYLVNVRMTIKPNVLLPMDTVAMVASESLLGGKYMSLEIGVDDEMIKTDGTGKITRTQAPMRLDDLIGQLIYGSKKTDAPASPDASSAGKAAAPSATPSAKVPAVAPAPAEPAHP